MKIKSSISQDCFTVTSDFDGLELSALLIAPKTAPKALLQLTHGMCEYKDRYIPAMEYLAQNGIACLIYDLRGHGKSINASHELGFFGENGADAIIEDTHQMTVWFKNRFPNKKLTLFGHSMGSLIVRCYLQKYDSDIDSLIVCGEVSQNPVGGIGLALANLLNFFKGGHAHSALYDNLALGAYSKAYPSTTTSNAWLNSDPIEVAKYDADPLCGFRFTTNAYKGLAQLLVRAFKAPLFEMNHPDLPIHFISGSGDPCRTSDQAFSNAVDFMRRLGYAPVTSHLFEGMRHEILNEPGRQIVYDEVLAHIAQE